MAKEDLAPAEPPQTDKMDVDIKPVVPDAKDKKDKKGAKKVEEEMSEEDLALKAELELLVQVLKEKNDGLYQNALETLRKLIRTSTSSMTSVPKPLKFLRPHYGALVEIWESWPASNNKKLFSDILSVLAMTFSEEDKLDTLRYRELGSQEPIGSWGHEYVKHLATEVGQAFNKRREQDPEANAADLQAIALDIAAHCISHNAEADACDLLLELEILDKLIPFVDKQNFQRICLYLTSCVSYVPYPEDILILQTVHTIFIKVERYPEAITLALKMNDADLVKQDYQACQDPLLRKQLAFVLARHQFIVDLDDSEVSGILSNSHLSEHFIALGRELDVLEPKVPEDIYKSHLENTRGAKTNLDSARQNLAATFVNGFVNVGFCKDKLMADTQINWLYKNKEHGMMSAAASVGLINLWDVDGGLSKIDPYLYVNEDFVKAGALMAIGIVNSGTRNEVDPALALLTDYVSDKSQPLRIGSISGLGLAYAGSRRQEILDLLLPVISDTSISMEVSAVAALSVGFAFVGTCHGDAASTILQALLERDEKSLSDTHARFMGLGLALLFLGRQEAVDATLETLKVIEHPIGRAIGVLVEASAYAGTGNVLKIQSMLHLCSDHLEKEKDQSYQTFATIGVALIAMGEDIGSQMALRMFNHLMQYGEPSIRKAVPLALGLLCVSNPLVNVLDTLGKYSHDADAEVAQSAIFAMGLVGCGTNNARLAQLLRQLAGYYASNASNLVVVRLAQGLLHMGKGTVTINPFHSNRVLMSPVAVAGLLTVILSFTDVNNLIFAKSHYLLYFIASAIYPRLLVTLDEDLKSIPVSVRVGQAVDVVGQAGRPKTITGFQTHSAPVLLAYTERAELATDEYLSLASVLEGFVILKKNPDYVEEKVEERRKK